MYSLILVIHIILAIFIVCLVLVQKSEGSALGGLGGGNSAANFMTGRSMTTMLSKMTAFLAFCFVLTTLTLGIMAKKQMASAPSLLIDTVAEAPVQPAPAQE